MSTPTPQPQERQGISNGQLLAMGPELRAKTVAGLSAPVRKKLAHLCVLGAAKEIKDADRHHERGQAGFAKRRTQQAHEHIALAAQLLAEDASKKI